MIVPQWVASTVKPPSPKVIRVGPLVVTSTLAAAACTRSASASVVVPPITARVVSPKV